MWHSKVLLGLVVLVAILCLASLPEVRGDVYGHNPRFSNNRLNETGQNRNNNNRLMDTQNNAKGGYCWGPKMYYYVGSQLSIEWTSQHSCSSPNAHCEMVIQYMCGDEVRDGLTTDTPPDNADPKLGEYFNKTVTPNPFTGEDKPTFVYGMHESYQYYQDCKKRERNKGLFVADQKPKGETARYTRQNPGGGRSGFECPEERDYYPYWHPAPWKDIAVLPNTRDRCDYYQMESQNVKSRNYCNITTFNNEAACVRNKGQWLTQPAWGIPAPDCVEAQATRDNHLGNTKTGQASTYNWTIPNDVNENCVLRLRYNISTGDYDPWSPMINSTLNGAKSPVTEDPSIGYMGRNVTLAFDTAQTGRTFQDRTYLFAIRPRPSDIPASARIFNLNVRGKRGNIVQVYPAVEYDFAPSTLDSRPGDYVHFQWTGCDTNPANNDGEGTRGTDRSNFVQIKNPGDNYPDPKPENDLFGNLELKYRFAHLDQYNITDPSKKCMTWEELLLKNENNRQRAEEDVQNCMKLNAAPKYFDGGLVQMEKTGVFHYMSSRNNNFSNRSQKGVITVQPLLPTWALALLGVGSVLFLVALAFGAAYVYARNHPNSRVAYTLMKAKAEKI